MSLHFIIASDDGDIIAEIRTCSNQTWRGVFFTHVMWFVIQILIRCAGALIYHNRSYNITPTACIYSFLINQQIGIRFQLASQRQWQPLLTNYSADTSQTTFCANYFAFNKSLQCTFSALQREIPHAIASFPLPSVFPPTRRCNTLSASLLLQIISSIFIIRLEYTRWPLSLSPLFFFLVACFGDPPASWLFPRRAVCLAVRRSRSPHRGHEEKE